MIPALLVPVPTALRGLLSTGAVRAKSAAPGITLGECYYSTSAVECNPSREKFGSTVLHLCQTMEIYNSPTETMPSRFRLTVNLSEEALKGLGEWADSQKRTTSNLAAAILTSALEAYRSGVYNDPASAPPLPKEKEDK